jgi:hypothetical protein
MKPTFFGGDGEIDVRRRNCEIVYFPSLSYFFVPEMVSIFEN